MIYGKNLDITTIVQCLTGWGPPFILQFQTDKKKAFLSSWFIDLLGMFIDPVQLYKKDKVTKSPTANGNYNDSKYCTH